METDIFTDRQKLIFYQVQILDKKEQDLKKTTIRTCMSKVEAQLLAFEKLDLGDKVAIISREQDVFFFECNGNELVDQSTDKPGYTDRYRKFIKWKNKK